MKKHRFLLMLGVLLIILFGVILGFYLYTLDVITSQSYARGIDLIEYVRQQLTGDPEEFQRVVLDMARGLHSHIVIVDSSSNLLADSHQDRLNLAGKYITAEMLEAKQKRGIAVSTVRSHDTRALAASVARYSVVEELPVIIAVSFVLDEVRRLELVFIVWLVVMLILLTWLVMLISGYRIRHFRAPIHKLLQHTRDAARSGFYKISIETGNPVLTALVDNFNALVDRYDLLVEADNKKYSRINTLLSNLKTGILMVDSRNIITLVNPQAEQFLDIDKVRLFKYMEIRNPLVRNILKETASVSRNGTSSFMTVTTDRMLILDITIESMTDKYYPFRQSGALVIVRDVTEMRRLEQLKDQFVSNVSHELRTPLTVISGFVETLQQWESLTAADRHTAVNIIELETERLKKLISELLALSRIEGQMDDEAAAEFDPRQLLSEVIGALSPLAVKRSIIVAADLSSSTRSLYGRASWFKQIFYNIHENALKYSPEGGSVTVRGRWSAGDYLLEVADNGEGIPEEERERIFERFYQINKSMTSKNRGSGLGLAIVKLMVENFGGRIDVGESTSGGALFEVSFPARKES